jgi:hypothetical protein
LIKIYEKTSRRVKLSINILLTPEEAEQLAFRGGLSDFLKKEIVSYKLEHPKFQAITFRYREEKGKKYIEFETGINFFKENLMNIFNEALIELGGESVTE